MRKYDGLMVINNYHFTSTLSLIFLHVDFFFWVKLVIFKYPILVFFLIKKYFFKIYLIGEWEKNYIIYLFFIFHFSRKPNEWVFAKAS